MLNEIDLGRADLNLLVLFETVLQEQHVGRSAARLNLSASAVSHGLGRLRRLLNDPLFIKTPKGVVPTARAQELAGAIAEILTRVRGVLATAEPFDPARSTRRFTIAAPDGVSAVFLPPLLAMLRQQAPGVDIRLRQLLPIPGDAQRAWQGAFDELDARAMDIAVVPSEDIPARFHHHLLFEEDFVIAARADHSFAAAPTLDAYCEAQHLVVSLNGDTPGFVDDALTKQNRSRRIALTVPNFMFALAMIADSDLICALPRHFAAMHAERFGVLSREAPLPLRLFRLNAVTPGAAMADTGLAWLFGVLGQAAGGPKRHSRPPAQKTRL